VLGARNILLTYPCSVLQGAESLEVQARPTLLALLPFTEKSFERGHVSSNSTPRVFVVGDEHVIASTLAAILKVHGYSATSFTSPLDALAAARSMAPNVLISDVAMPGISGVDLAIRMKAQYPECKILLFSGHAATQDLLEDARSQGHKFQWLEKPVHTSAMLSRIGELVTENSVVGSETSQSRLIHEAADAVEKRGKELLTDSLSISDWLKYERVSREAVSLLVKAARLRNHAKELGKDVLLIN
jgi:FixJ family two-component response regulator